MKTEYLFAVAFSVICLVAAMYIYTTRSTSAATMAYAVPKVATSSLASTGPGTNVQQLVATSSNCVSRVISTMNVPVMLTFGGSIPNGAYGHWQGASTTVAYDNGSFGCGAINAFSYSSTSVVVSALNQ